MNIRQVRTKLVFSKTVFACSILICSCLATDEALSQTQKFFNSRLPAGEIGAMQLARRPELNGVMQPVLLKAPEGASISIADGAGFGSVERDASLVSMQVGSTYRLKVSNIPFQYGDVYPTVELVDRMHAPTGKETRYPIPVDLTAEELEMALSGKFVVRVIYVEDPRRAIGARELPEQRYFEVMAHEDPYLVAGSLGRPVAILRMGSLAPDPRKGPSSEFLFGSPPITRHALQPRIVPFKPRPLRPEDMPAAPVKSEALPEAPDQPEASEEEPEIPEDLPERRVIDEQPGTLEDPANEATEAQAGDDPFAEEDPFGAADDPFGDDMPADDVGDDPFGDF